MIIGTDVSLTVCKEEGYLMMEFDGRKKFDPDRQYRVFAYLPSYIAEEIGVDPNTTHIDTEISFNDLVEDYERNEIALNRYGETDKWVNFENPNYHDFLILADDINGYKGLP